MGKIPVIIDTDIGGDIDDTWALCLALADDRLDIKLISVCIGDTAYKAALVAKILERAGRSDIPIAVGDMRGEEHIGQKGWLADFDLRRYAGVVHYDYKKALYESIMQNDGPISILAMGPYVNLAALFSYYPACIPNVKVLSMGGSLRRGYMGTDGPCAEYNVIVDHQAMIDVIASACDFTLLPLDVCRDLIIAGQAYRKFKTSEAVYAKIIMENYRCWQREYAGGAVKFDLEAQSSVLFDFVPIFYLLHPEHFAVEEVSVTVHDDGTVRETADGGARIKCATEIYDQERLMDESVELLTMEG